MYGFTVQYMRYLRCGFFDLLLYHATSAEYSRQLEARSPNLNELSKNDEWCRQLIRADSQNGSTHAHV